jgi:hypothetical protein
MTRAARWLSRLDRAIYAPAPAARLAALRVLLGAFALCYVVVRAGNLASVARFEASAFAPVGPVGLLSAPLAPAVVYALLAATVLAGALFCVGYRYKLSGPGFALLLLWVTSYRSSWGMVFHTENLLVWHVLLCGLAPAADAFALDARRVDGVAVEHGRYGWAIRAMCVVTVVTYVLAGVAKLRISGFEWVGGDVLRIQIAYDNVRKLELGSSHSPLGAALVRVAWVFPPLAWLTLLIELGAPLALLGGRWARAFCVGAWLFHWGVALLMAIAFRYPLSFFAYLSFFRVERFWALKPVRRWLLRAA